VNGESVSMWEEGGGTGMQRLIFTYRDNSWYWNEVLYTGLRVHVRGIGGNDVRSNDKLDREYYKHNPVNIRLGGCHCIL